MTLVKRKKDILKVLGENIRNNPSPDAVRCESIAKRLELRPEDVVDALKSMNDMGVVVSDIENRYAIITCKGFEALQT